jgi:hypothetical protein
LRDFEVEVEDEGFVRQARPHVVLVVLAAAGEDELSLTA